MKDRVLKAEILAPASSFESVKAAYNAGADAIYIGGLKFGARAYADNMSEQELLGAIDYAHLHNKKIYMTVNTLLKENELKDELYNYLLPYYEQGLDAVIVQDLGVMSFIKEVFPHMAIHASTQMAITGEYMPEYLEKIGVERVVTARELSLNEIKAIHAAAPDIEIESFVHGALCMGYSGMCFFSSFLGERSGNRGRCAQACRLPYCLLDENKKAVKELSGKNYILSPKDICTVDILPQIIEAGVYSLKIEGRMKRTEYTAGVTAIYRKYLDMYLEKNISDYSVSKEDRNTLAELYNRGGFSGGYYNKRNGKDMMSLDRPNHFGVCVGKVKLQNNKLVMKAAEDLYKSDVLEIREEKLDNRTNVLYNEFKVDKNVKKNEQTAIPISVKSKNKFDNVPVYRMKNEYLLNQINQKYVMTDNRIRLCASLSVAIGNPIELVVYTGAECGYNNIDSFENPYGKNAVSVSGPIIEPAKNQGATKEQLIKSLKKTGQTEFVFDKIDIELEDNCFVPVKVINDLRRKAIDIFIKNCLKDFRRNSIFDNADEVKYKYFNANSTIEKRQINNCLNRSELYVSISSIEQIEGVLGFTEVKGCYIDLNMFNPDTDYQLYNDIKKKFSDAKTDIYISLPVILRKASTAKISENAEWIFGGVKGVLVHTAEQLAFINTLVENNIICDLNIVSDYMLYAMNSKAVKFLSDNNVFRYTMPVELTQNELSVLNSNKYIPSELIFYGYMPMMFTAQCQRKNAGKCTHECADMFLKDRKGKKLHVRTNCNYCYNTIYNSAPLSLFGLEENVKRIGPDVLRLQFTNETKQEVKRIISGFIGRYFNEDFSGDNDFINEFTRGHFKRGVE